MVNKEKIEPTDTLPNALTQESFSSLEKAEQDLHTDDIFLQVILPSIKSKESSLEIKNSEDGLRSAIVRGIDGEIVFFNPRSG